MHSTETRANQKRNGEFPPALSVSIQDAGSVALPAKAGSSKFSFVRVPKDGRLAIAEMESSEHRKSRVSPGADPSSTKSVRLRRLRSSRWMGPRRLVGLSQRAQ
jgi:hypothetical protein